MSTDLSRALHALQDAERRAADADAPDPATLVPALARRVGRRRAVRAGGAAVAASVLVGGAAVGVHALGSPPGPAVPAVPASPAPSVSTSTAPAWVEPLIDPATLPQPDGVDGPGWSNEFALVATAIADAYREDYAGSQIDSDEEETGRIAFRGAVPPRAQATIDLLPGVRAVPGTGFNEDEKFQAVLALGDAVRAALGTELQNIAGWTETLGGELVVAYLETEPGTPAAAERSRVAHAAAAAFVDAHPLYTARVETMSSPPMPE